MDIIFPVRKTKKENDVLTIVLWLSKIRNIKNIKKLSMCDASTSTPTSIVSQDIDIDISIDVSMC